MVPPGTGTAIVSIDEGCCAASTVIADGEAAGTGSAAVEIEVTGGGLLARCLPVARPRAQGVPQRRTFRS